MLVGIVSDTHAYFDPRLVSAFAGVDVILHAGDVCSPAVIEGLRALAPVHAVQGNNDAPLGGLGLPVHLDLALEGVQIHLVHQLPHARPRPDTSVVVYGHSHRVVSEWREGVLFLNPGAAGRAGFHALQTAALLSLTGGAVASLEIVTLGPREKLARPSARRVSRAS